jgi:hypothetical protein
VDTVDERARRIGAARHIMGRSPATEGDRVSIAAPGPSPGLTTTEYVVSTHPDYTPAGVLWRRVPIPSRTRKRLEATGWHPKRIQLGPKLCAYQTVEAEAYAADPEGWARRNRAEHSA